jgi:hypothetical protein
LRCATVAGRFAAKAEHQQAKETAIPESQYRKPLLDQPQAQSHAIKPKR